MHLSEYAIGIDLGGTKVELGVVDRQGKIHALSRFATPVQGGAAAVEGAIIAHVRELERMSLLPIGALGIGAAGQIDPQTGEILFAPNLNWHHVPLKRHLTEALALPTWVGNDVRAITMGEWLYGAGKGVRDMMCLFLGTGIGGGVVSGGILLTGSTYTLGEIGHLTVDFHGPICSCGKRGCLEAFASGWGIAARARQAIERDKGGNNSRYLSSLVNGNLNELAAQHVFQASRERDAMSQQLVNETMEALIAGVASLVNAFNPALLILGGGVIEGNPTLVEEIRIGVQREALQAATRSLSIVTSALGAQSGVIGAAAAAFRLLESDTTH